MDVLIRALFTRRIIRMRKVEPGLELFGNVLILNK